MSGGLATIQPNEQVESLIQRADAALYAAKSAGRNCSFTHDGVNCRPAEGHRIESPAQSARLVELINSPDAAKPVISQAAGDAGADFGTLPATREDFDGTRGHLQRTSPLSRKARPKRGPHVRRPIRIAEAHAAERSRLRLYSERLHFAANAGAASAAKRRRRHFFNAAFCPSFHPPRPNRPCLNS